jgi:hypothetical protein
VRARRLNAGVVLNDEKVLRRQAEGAMDEMDAWACEGLADPSLLQLAARVFALCTLHLQRLHPFRHRSLPAPSLLRGARVLSIASAVRIQTQRRGRHRKARIRLAAPSEAPPAIDPRISVSRSLPSVISRRDAFVHAPSTLGCTAGPPMAAPHPCPLQATFFRECTLPPPPSLFPSRPLPGLA